MTKVIRDHKALYNRDDCVYFIWKTHESCCGRTQKTGHCTLPDHLGREIDRPCFTPLEHCRYTPQEEEVTNG